MSVKDLRELLERVEDTRELVLRDQRADGAGGELLAAWRAARADAGCAYEDWQRVSGPESYAVYVAAEDRADAAAQALAGERVTSLI